MTESLLYVLAVLVWWAAWAYVAWWLGEKLGGLFDRALMALLRRYRPDWVKHRG